MTTDTQAYPLLRIAFVLMLAAGAYAPAARAASIPGTVSDVQYATVLDTTPSQILLNEMSFGTTTPYLCGVASHTCQQTALTTLVPDAASSTSTFVNPARDRALTTLRIPNAAPRYTLNRIGSGILTPLATVHFTHEISRILWSSDSTTLLLISGDGTVASFDTKTDTLTELTNLPAGASWLTLSPDGYYLAYYLAATASRAARTFGVFDTRTDTTYERTEPLAYWDLLTEGVRLFAFSPDSSTLLYLDDRDDYQTLYQVSLKSLTKTASATSIQTALGGTRLISKPYTIADMQWESPSTILFSANRDDALRYGLYEYAPASGKLTKVSDNVSFDAAMTMITPTTLLFKTADASGRFPKIFDTTTKAVSSFAIPGTDQSSVTSSAKTVKAGVLNAAYLPAASATSTLLVWFHGGPDRQDSTDYNSYMSYGGYDWMLKRVQAAGVPVLKLEYPGSVGYGRTFAESIKGGVGTTDVAASQAAITSFAKANGFKNIYLVGNSYGGYLALKLLSAHPESYQGAYSLSGVTDWQALLASIPSSIFSVDFNGLPSAQNATLYQNASIVSHLSSFMGKKVIVVQGDADGEVPYSQSTLLDAALTTANIPHDYTTLSGEDHIYAQPSSFTTICQKAFGFVGFASASSCSL